MSKLVFIDTHCHLQMKTYKNDIEKIIDNAHIAGVKVLINVGFNIESSEKAVELSRKYPMMFAAVGIHPHDARTYTNRSLSILDDLLKDDKVVAIGEIGLDLKRNLSPLDTQIKVFNEQLAFAQERGVPVIVHIRDAYSIVNDILEKKKPEKVLLHCFSGTKGDAEWGIKMGYYVSFAGNITYSHNKILSVINDIPLSKIVIETDAPYLSPVPHRGKRNEPSFIRYTAEKMAEIRGVTIKEIAEATTKNAKDFFQVEFDG
ncbi:TatD family hydrolase [candidate division WOR-3 bacterium]|nr:TatD family hydrolase [candidate division WOR-3 bacterium]